MERIDDLDLVIVIVIVIVIVWPWSWSWPWPWSWSWSCAAFSPRQVRQIIQAATATMMTAEATWKYGSVCSKSQLLPKYSPVIATAQTTAVCESVADRPSSTAWVIVPRIATMKAAIMVLEWPGSSPCRIAQQDGARHKQPGIAVKQQRGELSHRRYPSRILMRRHYTPPEYISCYRRPGLYGPETGHPWPIPYATKRSCSHGSGGSRGRLTALERQLDDDSDCIAVLQQIAAIRGAVNGLMAAVIEDHLTDHVVNESDLAQRQQDLDVVLQVLKSYLK